MAEIAVSSFTCIYMIFKQQTVLCVIFEFNTIGSVPDFGEKLDYFGSYPLANYLILRDTDFVRMWSAILRIKFKPVLAGRGTTAVPRTAVRCSRVLKQAFLYNRL